ncbi:MAG TPA: phosphoribosylamine--glycine ligase [Candidatus Omnitrophica bacterium]|nr:phosphoribosylamine--glycine ligase [Candidatus Omnitrophota bacterium]
MDILVIGSGAREHALVWKISKSKRVKKIYCAPGNAGIAQLAECVTIPADDIKGLLKFARSKGVDLTVVGPEAPLAAGIIDEFQKAGLKAFGPSMRAARLEASKCFAKEIMKKYGVPTADFEVCRTMDEVRHALKRLKGPVVVKADGLAAGKGVVVCDGPQAAEDAAKSMLVDKIFGEAGETIVIEECLFGQEASILALTNGVEAVALASSQDHKRIFDGDKGPNTGGMGAYSPAPVVTDDVMDNIMDTAVMPVLSGMQREGADYKGILYAGIMLTKEGPKVLEFNVRFGDPETQAVLPRLETDLIDAMLWTLGAGQPAPKLKWADKSSVCVVLTSGGYPGPYEKGKEISGLERASELKDVVVFHAGTKKPPITDHRSQDIFLTDGGRVLGVTALGKDIKAAIDNAYKAVSLVNFEGMHFRRDIGWRALKK